MTTNWLPGRRELQLAMAKNWPFIIMAHGSVWQVPPEHVSQLTSLAAAAAEALELAQSSNRSPAITAHCKAAFDALVEKLRFIKNRYFLSPPLVDEDYITLGLKPKDTDPTPVPPPTAQAEADITRPGVHLLDLHIRQVSGSSDIATSDYGCRVYHGVLPPSGASTEAALGPKRELVKAPLSGDDLPHSRFTRRKRELFDFPAEDSGKTAYFCIRYENAKGEPGPWGPIFSSIIP